LQGFNKCAGDDFNLPFVMTTAASHGEITDAGKANVSIYLN